MAATEGMDKKVSSLGLAGLMISAGCRVEEVSSLACTWPPSVKGRWIVAQTVEARKRGDGVWTLD